MRTRKILIRMGVLVLVLGLAYGGLDLAGAAGPPGGVSGDVTVDNTATNPVPVQQQGASTVAGTVGIDPAANTVQLPPTETVQTSAADNPAFQPVSAGCEVLGQPVFNTATCTPESATGPLVVPAGKELVVTSVSMDAELPLGEVLALAWISHDVGSVSTQFWLPIGSPQDTNSATFYNAGLATQFYVDSGTSPHCGWQFGGGATILDGQCSIDGYFVTLP